MSTDLQHVSDCAEIDKLVQNYAEQFSGSAVPTLSAAKTKVLLTNFYDKQNNLDNTENINDIQAVNLIMSKLLGIRYKTVQQDFSRKVLPFCQFMLPKAITNWIKKYCIPEQNSQEAIKHIKKEIKKYFNEKLFNFTKVDSLLRNSIKRKANPICLKEFDEFMRYCSVDAIKEQTDKFLTGTHTHEETCQEIEKLFQRIFTGYQKNLIMFDQIQEEKPIHIDVLEQDSESELGLQIKQVVESDPLAELQNIPKQAQSTNNNQ
ncbi:Hypothetical_protein [Hexamita inflata]|uniref:Hypothetical_protein n=1 Tax=Hexamita inflata TaxID=28002 RepID=A0AA86NRT2_9EUKA|nr:Hypothetical protein HINF_LOCUS12957 [Hexamita inflata]